ncbi:MAG TPA: hypothetical protein VGE69_07825 [Pseudomonadales bacterium]
MPDTMQASLLQCERESLSTLFALAHARQREAQARAPQPPRFLLESARSMAAHLARDDTQMRASLDALALWQFYLPAAMGTSSWDFAMARECLPVSFARVHAALQALETRPQLVIVAYHMAGFPLLSSLVGSALSTMRRRPLHMLVATNNLGWLKRAVERWNEPDAHFIGTQPRDMRLLLGGLRDGSIERLLILVDGPHAPGPAGTRALPGISPGLGFRTPLLERLHALGLPLLPITHHWHDEQLVVTPHALLDPARVDATATIDAIAAHIETLLRAQPEQWLNWAAARIRT